MTQNEIRAKLKLLASLAEAASVLEEEIRKDFCEKGDDDLIPSAIIENVKNGNMKDVNTAMSLLKNYLSDIPEGEPVVMPYVDFVSADNFYAGFQYPSGDELFASLGVSDRTYQIALTYDAVNSKGDDVVTDLALAEIKQGELAEAYGLPRNNKDVDVHTWEDVYSEDYTKKFTISHEELVGMLESDKEREG